VVTEYYPGTLASGASTYYSFTASGNLSSYTSYDLKVWCSLSGDTVGANDTLFSLVQHLPANYCLSSATYGSSGSDIGNVTFSNLNNGIPTPTNNNVTAINAYTDFTSSVPPVQLATGQLYPLTVKKINKGNTNSFSVIKVFIDYNRSGTYEEATETVLNVATNPGTYQVSSNITIPQWVNPGQAQMRVVLQETTNQSYVHPCGSYSYGETEDYMVYLYNVFPVDAGIEQIISPASTVPQASSQSVSVSIRNYGLDTLTSLTITYQHNNNAPVVQSWTGTLLPSASTIVLLSNPLTVAPFSNTLCVSTSVPGDVNFINDQICKTFNGELLQDAIAVAIIDSFNTACDVGMEEITLRIKNVGLDTISGGLTGSYYIVGQTNVVTETINATIPPDSSYNYTFNQDVDLTAYTQDTIWKLVAYFTLVGDIENELDTAYASVESLYSPPEPLVSNVSIPYATAATLSASSSDSIFWYESQNAQQEIGSGPTYTTPILYGRKVYWVEAQADVVADAVSIGTGTSSQNYIPFFYNYDYGWSAMIYTAAELGIDGKIDTIGFYVTTSHNNYTHVDQKLYLGHTTTSTFPDGAYPGTTGLTLVWDDDLVINGPGWLRIPFQQSFDYNGTDNLLILWENREGTYLGNPTIQFAASNTSVNRAKYKYQDGSFPTSSGTLTANRPNIILYGRGVGCPGPRVPDTVFISSNIPLVDGSLIGVASPISSSSFGHSETVTVSIQNYGTQAIGNFPISLQVNNGNVVTETIGNSIGPDSVMDYSFTFGVNMLNYGNYDFKVWLDIPYDSFPANDTLAFHIIHPIPEYCPSFATNPSVYEDIGNVSLGTLNNGDTTPVIQNPNAIQGYTDFTQSVVPPILFQNKAYALSVAATSSATINPLPTYVRGYFDLNRDGILDPVSERLFSETISDTSRVATASVSIPDTSAYGTMLMRVVLDRLTSAPPCGSYSYGETEDYLVEVWPSAIVPPYSCITRDQTGNVLVSWDTVPSQAATFLHYKLLYRELPSGSFILLDSISTASVLSFTHIGSPAGTALEYKLECWFNRDDYVFSVPAFDTVVPYIAGDVLKCVGDTVTVWLGGGYDALDTIVWDFGTANVLSGIGFGPYKLSYPSAGSFQILATLQQACGTSYLRTDVAVYPQPQLQVTGPHYFCPDVPLILVASGGTNYLWNNGSTSDTLILSGLTMPTLLSVTVSEPGGCFEAKNIFIRPIETFQNSEICIVSTEQTQDNTIQWFPVPGKDTKAYNVYFADAALQNQWNLLGQWPFDASGLITDSLHHSPAYQLQYAIQVVDSCDSLSVLSPEVGPLYLSGELVGGVVNLEWENYIGPVPTSEVIIYRKEGSGSYSIIDTVSMFDQTYSDVAPPQGMVYYYLEIEGFNCPFSGSPSKASNSNVVVVNTVGLPENGIPGLEVFLVQKGPALLIRWNENIPKTMNLTIFDALGRISRRSSLPHLSSQYIDLASLIPGVYSYQLTLGDGRMISGKLIR
jgi:hypothetical protein